MSTTLIFILMGSIVLGLSIYLGVLYSKLQAQKIQMAKEKDRLQEIVNEHKNSIVLISKATIQGQCDPAESCIRIFKLLSFIECNEIYSVTSNYYKEISSLSILKARKDLTSKEAFEEDKIRFKAEEKFKASYFNELERLIRDFS